MNFTLTLISLLQFPREKEGLQLQDQGLQQLQDRETRQLMDQALQQLMVQMSQAQLLLFLICLLLF